MDMPEVDILGFNQAQEKMGEAEEVVGAVLAEMSGELSGIMMLILKEKFIKQIVSKVLSQEMEDILEMGEMDQSLLREIGNIMISSYVNALSSLTGLQISLSVPQIAVNMLGGVLSLPMALLGIESDKLMMITGEFYLGGEENGQQYPAAARHKLTECSDEKIRGGIRYAKTDFCRNCRYEAYQTTGRFDYICTGIVHWHFFLRSHDKAGSIAPHYAS